MSGKQAIGNELTERDEEEDADRELQQILRVASLVSLLKVQHYFN